MNLKFSCVLKLNGCALPILYFFRLFSSVGVLSQSTSITPDVKGYWAQPLIVLNCRLRKVKDPSSGEQSQQLLLSR